MFYETDGPNYLCTYRKIHRLKKKGQVVSENH